MKPRYNNRLLFGLLLLLLSAGLTVGCDKRKTADPDKAEAKEAKVKTGEPDTKAKAGAGDAKACDQYKEKFCEAVGGDQSQACGAMGMVAPMMSPKACEAGLTDIAFTKKAVGEMGAKCDELVKKLCADLGEETQTCAMVTNATKQFPPERCVAMLGQYPKVLAELKQQEARNKPLDAEKRKLIEGEKAADFGPKDAKVTLVEFSDFQCPYCSKAAEVTTAVKNKYKGKSVRFVFRHFPLSFHKDAHLASQAALAAGAQGKFWEYHDKLFANQRALKRPQLEQYAKDLGLNMGKFKKALDDGTYKDQVDADFKMGQEVAVNGTPTLFINGQRVPNPTDTALVNKMIDKELGQ